MNTSPHHSSPIDAIVGTPFSVSLTKPKPTCLSGTSSSRKPLLMLPVWITNRAMIIDKFQGCIKVKGRLAERTPVPRPHTKGSLWLPAPLGLSKKTMPIIGIQ